MWQSWFAHGVSYHIKHVQWGEWCSQWAVPIPPTLPPKYENWNGVHHGKIEGVGGKLLAMLWPPQGRSDYMHGKILILMMVLSSMLSSKWKSQPQIYAMCWGWMESWVFDSQDVSLSICGTHGISSVLGLKWYGLQEWPKLPDQIYKPWSASSKKSSSPNSSSDMRERGEAWKSWAAHCFSWNMDHVR